MSQSGRERFCSCINYFANMCAIYVYFVHLRYSISDILRSKFNVDAINPIWKTKESA